MKIKGWVAVVNGEPRFYDMTSRKRYLTEVGFTDVRRAALIIEPKRKGKKEK